MNELYKERIFLNSDDDAYISVSLHEYLEGQIDGWVVIHENDTTVRIELSCFSERGIEQTLDKLNSLIGVLQDTKYKIGNKLLEG